MEAGVDLLHIGFLHGLHHQASQLLRRGMFGSVSAGDGKGAVAVGHYEILSVLGLVVETVSGVLHPVSYTHLDVYKRQVTSKPVYGYLMDEDENFIIDEEAAPVVKQIYLLCLAGNLSLIHI